MIKKCDNVKTNANKMKLNFLTFRTKKSQVGIFIYKD